jgi:hypothetical protein
VDVIARTRATLASGPGFVAVLLVWLPTSLWADGHLDRWAQDAVSVVTWALLAATFAAATAVERRQIVVVVVVATMLEVTFSLVWGLYIYRFHNIPLYVPPGHGLIYLMAVRLSRFPALRASRRRTAGVVTAGVSAWVVGGLLLATPRDLVGACLLPALLVCLWRTSRWNVYAGAFIATTLLEILGTRFGNWRWAGTVPGIGIGQGNPPSAIAAGYCLLDAVVLFLSSRKALSLAALSDHRLLQLRGTSRPRGAWRGLRRRERPSEAP